MTHALRAAIDAVLATGQADIYYDPCFDDEVGPDHSIVPSSTTRGVEAHAAALDRLGAAARAEPDPWDLVGTLARLTRAGEPDDFGQPYGQDAGDAVDTLDRVIREARHLLDEKETQR